MSEYTREQIAAVTPTEDDWEEFWSTRDPYDWECEQCGGEGHVEYNDCPEVWGEGCPSEVNHLVACPGCQEAEYDRQRAVRVMILKRSHALAALDGEAG